MDANVKSVRWSYNQEQKWNMTEISRKIDENKEILLINKKKINRKEN